MNDLQQLITNISTNQTYKQHITKILKYLSQRIKSLIIIILIYLSLSSIQIKYSNILYTQIYSLPLSHHKIINQEYKHIYYSYSFKNYLERNQVKNLLELRCTVRCFIEKDYLDDQFEITYAYNLYIPKEQDEYMRYYDWINFNQIDFTIEQFLILIKTLKKITKTGISFTSSLQQQPNSNKLDHFIKILQKNGFGYNYIDSFKLRRNQGKIIYVFTRYDYVTGAKTLQQKNFISIHSNIRLRYDLPFLREWIGYHISLGFDKFFLYDIQGEEQEGCIDATQQEIARQWQKIMQDYSNNIIYIPWNPPKIHIPYPLSLVYSSTPSTEHDYITHYRQATKYTIFLEPNEMIFNTIGIQITKQIMDLQSSGYNVFEIQERLFVSRFCSQERYMLSNYLYYKDKNPNKKIIFKTINFIPTNNKQKGYIQNIKIYSFDSNTWRVNSYSLDQSKLKSIQNIVKSNVSLSYDKSAQSRKKVISQICQAKCYIDLSRICKKKSLQCLNEISKLVTINSA